MNHIWSMIALCALLTGLPAVAQEKADSLGDPLPDGALQRLGTLRLKYNAGVSDIQYLPDGLGVIATGSALHVWDLSAGELQTTYNPTGEAIASVNISEDGSKVLFITGGDVVEWSLANQQVIHRFSTGQEGLRWAFYSPDETRVLTTGTVPPTIKEFSIETGEELVSIEGTVARFYKAIYGPGGKSAFVGCGFDIILAHYDLDTGDLINEWFKNYCVYDLCLSPDEQRLLVGSRSMGTEWKIDGYEELKRFGGHHGGAVNCVAYCNEPEQILTGSRDGSIRRWNRTTGEVLLRWFPHESYVTMMRVSPDGANVLSYGARLVAESALETGDPTREFERHAGSVEACAWLPDGVRAASASSDGTLRVWDTATGKTVRTIDGANLGAWSLAVSPDGTKAAAGCKDGVLREFSITDGSLLREMKGHRGYVRSAAYTPDGTLLLSSAGDGTVRIWEPGATDAAAILEGHRGGVLGVATSPDGALVASAGRDGTVRIWDIDTHEQLHCFEAHRGWAECVAFAGGGQYVVSTGRDGRILRWNLQSAELADEITGEGWMKALAVDPTGRYAYVSGDARTITCWDLATGEQVAAYAGHQNNVAGLAVSPDGGKLLSASADTTLLAWGLR